MSLIESFPQIINLSKFSDDLDYRKLAVIIMF